MVLADTGRDLAEIPYFLGTMILLLREASARPQAVEVMDGQQRLITLTILLAVLRDFLPKTDEAQLKAGQARLDEFISRDGTLWVDLREGDARLFLETVQQAGATRRTWRSEPEGSAQRNILANRRVLFQAVQNLRPLQRAQLAECILDHCRVLVLETANPNYAYEIFLRTNDRGRPLSEGDMVRGEIVGPLSPAQRQTYDQVLEQIEEYQQGDDQRRKRSKTFFSHIHAIHGFRNKMIDDLRALIRDLGGTRQFTNEVMRPLADAYLIITDMSPARRLLPREIQRQLKLLSWYERFGDDDWVAPTMQWLAKYGGNERLTVNFLTELDRFVHVLLTLGWGRAARSAIFDRINRALRESLQQTPPEPSELFMLTAEQQRKSLRRIARKLHATDSQTCRLVLLRADQFLSQRDTAHYQHAIDSEKYTVEHAVPGGPSPAQNWVADFPNNHHRRICSESIGNLVLVTEKQNHLAERKPFDQKQEIFFAKGKSPFLLTNWLLDKTGWGQEQIRERQDGIMKAVQQMWRLDGVCDSSYLIRDES